MIVNTICVKRINTLAELKVTQNALSLFRHVDVIEITQHIFFKSVHIVSNLVTFFCGTENVIFSRTLFSKWIRTETAKF